jgi:hypothetical protein
MHSNLFEIKCISKNLNYIWNLNWLLIHENINKYIKIYGFTFLNIKENCIIISSSK